MIVSRIAKSFCENFVVALASFEMSLFASYTSDGLCMQEWLERLFRSFAGYNGQQSSSRFMAHKKASHS